MVLKSLKSNRKQHIFAEHLLSADMTSSHPQECIGRNVKLATCALLVVMNQALVSL
jgi:hypothetical protein